MSNENEEEIIEEKESEDFSENEKKVEIVSEKADEIEKNDETSLSEDKIEADEKADKTSSETSDNSPKISAESVKSPDEESVSEEKMNKKSDKSEKTEAKKSKNKKSAAKKSKEKKTESETEISEKKADEEKIAEIPQTSSKKGTKKGFGTSFSENYNKLQSNIGILAIVCVASVAIMIFVALAVFLGNVKGPEQVLVPNVVGKKLEDALLEMQVKELYPKINLRYSNTPGDEGTILEQSPESGAIVKGYSRVNLVVSRGVVVDKVGNYVGMNLDELRMNLQTLFAGQTRPLIILAEPEYKPDAAAAGTILEQNPPEGTSISQPVTVQLIVSRGPNYDNTKAPNLIGQSVNDVLQTMARSKVIFDFTSHIASDQEKAGTVVSQDSFTSEYIPNYSRVNVELALPKEALNDNIYGIFSASLSEYPYPVPMRLEAVPVEGNSYTILNFSHSGGSVTIPYAVPSETKLVLYVVDKAVASLVVN